MAGWGNLQLILIPYLLGFRTHDVMRHAESLIRHKRHMDAFEVRYVCTLSIRSYSFQAITAMQNTPKAIAAYYRQLSSGIDLPLLALASRSAILPATLV